MGKKIIVEFHARVNDSELGHGPQVDRLAAYYRSKNSIEKVDDDGCVEMALGHMNAFRQVYAQLEGEQAESYRSMSDELLAKWIVDSLVETGDFEE